MCDYSLESIMTRPAAVGDKLVTTSFTNSTTRGFAALDHPDRSGTSLIFFDAVDPKPAAGSFPAELNLSYTVTPIFAAPPARQDSLLQLSYICQSPRARRRPLSSLLRESRSRPTRRQPIILRPRRGCGHCGLNSQNRSAILTIRTSPVCSPMRPISC